jgi:hypothetical protein
MSQTITDWIKLLLPLLVVNYMLVAFCLWLIVNKGVRNLKPWIWAMIVIFVNGIGSIVFLIVGRKLEND